MGKGLKTTGYPVDQPGSLVVLFLDTVATLYSSGNPNGFQITSYASIITFLDSLFDECFLMSISMNMWLISKNWEVGDTFGFTFCWFCSWFERKKPALILGLGLLVN
jgi:hypothetical protein